MKKIILLAVWLVALIGTACATEQLPPDVSAYLKQRDICDHLRGEIPDQPDRTIIDRINSACKGTDTALAKLKLKYETDPAVLRWLAPLDTSIEGGRQ